MDYLKWKKKALLTSWANILLVEGEAGIVNEITVSSLVCNGVPFLCLIGSEADVESAIELCEGKIFTLAIAKQLNVFTTISMLQSAGIAVNMSSGFDMYVMADILNSKETTAVINAIFGINTSSFVAKAEDIESSIETILSEVVNIDVGQIMETDAIIDSSFGFDVSSALSQTIYISLEVVMALAQVVSASSQPGVVFESHPNSILLVSGAFSIGKGKVANISRRFTVTFSPRIIITKAKNIGMPTNLQYTLTANVKISAGATLEYYSEHTLESMGGSTLQELASYIE